MELAFLNCCETGNGRLFEAGIVGLARAFHMAGALEVVCYRGGVPDTARTVRFTLDFYKNYLECREADQALAASQRKAASEEVPEEFWASYYVMKIPQFDKSIFPKTWDHRDTNKSADSSSHQQT